MGNDNKTNPQHGRKNLNEGRTIDLPIPDNNSEVKKGLSIPLPTPERDNSPIVNPPKKD